MSTKEAKNEISRELRGDSHGWSLGWTLLHSLWEGAIVSAVLAAVLLAVRSPRVRYAAACAAMLAMLAGCGLTLLWLLSDEAGGRRNAQAHVIHPASLSPVAGAADRWVPSLAAIAPWLGPFWIAGVCFFCLWYFASWASVQRMRRRGVCCAAASWQGELARLGAQVRVSRPVLLLESCFAAAPVVLGHFRPLILLPIGLLAGPPPAQMEAVLAHELAHIRRHDYLMNLLHRFAEGLAVTTSSFRLPAKPTNMLLPLSRWSKPGSEAGKQPLRSQEEI